MHPSSETAPPAYKAYAGIGSQGTPTPYLRKLSDIGEALALSGFTLRSGHADGADKAFEAGCDSAGGKKEIYLPFRGFNGSKSPFHTITPEALALAERTHPGWVHCSPTARKLHARNGYQVLGKNLNNPVAFITCYTKGGRGGGGTGQALRIAATRNIPVLDLGAFKEHQFDQVDVRLNELTNGAYGRFAKMSAPTLPLGQLDMFACLGQEARTR